MPKKLSKEQIAERDAKRKAQNKARRLKENKKQRDERKRQYYAEYRDIMKDNIGRICIGGLYSKFRGRLELELYAERTIKMVVEILQKAIELFDRDTEYIYHMSTVLLPYATSFVIADRDTDKTKYILWYSKSEVIVFDGSEQTREYMLKDPDRFGFASIDDVKAFLRMPANGTLDSWHDKRMKIRKEMLEESD